jgi:hypothetical protein
MGHHAAFLCDHTAVDWLFTCTHNDIEAKESLRLVPVERLRP